MIDCDDVVLLLAAGNARTLSGVEDTQLHRHLAECESCRDLTKLADTGHIIAKHSDDARDDPDLLVLPTIDPVVFTGLREVARGGMGRITRARDRRLGREVAIKEVIGPGVRARFEREVRITAQLQHPAIVPVYEAGTWPDGSAFYTMRLVSGGTLADAITHAGTLEQRLALLPHVIAATDALAYAHSRGIIHRDLKPNNVLVGEFGETVVIDWGLAKELRRAIEEAPASTGVAAGSDLTVVGSVMGTPGFMPPEQAAGAELDERADVYALGAILYNVLSGRPPYHGELPRPSVDELIALARERPPARLAELVPRLPADLVAICEKAMARGAADRYPSAKEMAEELRRFSAGQLLRSRDYRLSDLLVRWIRRHRAAVISGLLAVIAIAVIGVGAIVNVTRSRSAERSARQTAEMQKHEADDKVNQLLVERGRAQLLAGDRAGALAALGEAAHRGETSLAVRHMLAAADRDVEPSEAVLQRNGLIETVAFTDDGRARTVDGEQIVTWDGDRPAVTRERHVAMTHAVIAGAGRRVVMSEADGSLAAFDAERGSELWHAMDPQFKDPRLVADRAATRLVVLSDGSTGTTAQLRDLEHGTVLASLDGVHVESAAISEDGGRIALCDAAGKILVWDAAGKPLAMAKPGRCWHMVAFFDAARLVVQADVTRVELRDLATGSVVSLGTYAGQISSIAADPQIDRIAIGDGSGAVELWNSAGDLLGTSHDPQGSVDTLVFSPDGALLAGGGRDKQVFVWDSVALALLRTVHDDHEAGFDPIAHLAWSPDSKRLATLRGSDRVVIEYPAPRGRRIAHTTSYTARVASNLVVSSDGHRVTMRRLSTGEIVRDVPLEGSPNEIAIDAAGGGVITQWHGDWLEFFDVTTGAQLPVSEARAPNGARMWSTLSANGHYVLEVPSNKADLRFWVIETATGRVLDEQPFDYVLNGAITDTGTTACVDTADGAAVLVRVATRDVIHIELSGESPHKIAFDPTGTHVVLLGMPDHALHTRNLVIDVATGRAVTDLAGLRAPAQLAVFDAAGTTVALWAADRSVHVWQLPSGKLLAHVEGVAYPGVALSADGARLATAQTDGTITILDVASAKPIDVLHGDGARVKYLAWSADGTRLVSVSSATKTLSIWDVHAAPLDAQSRSQQVP